MSEKEFILLSFCYQWRTGRTLARMYREETGREIGYGTLYGCMRRLREAGLVETRDKEDEYGRFREFKITSKGSGNRRREQERRDTAPSRLPGLRPSHS